MLFSLNSRESQEGIVEACRFIVALKFSSFPTSIARNGESSFYNLFNKTDDEDFHTKINYMKRSLEIVSLLESKALDCAGVVSAHNILDVSSDCYGIRKKNLIIGPRTNKACFYPPKYEIVESMLNEWILDLSKVNKKCNVSLLELYFKFIHIHPFGDGNGRFSRAFLFSLGDDFYLFSTYVHATKGYMHNDFVKNAFALQAKDLTLHYYNGYLEWKRDFLDFIKLSKKILSEDYAKILADSEQVISRIINVLKIGVKYNKIESNLVNSLVTSHLNMVKLYYLLLMTDSFIKNEMHEYTNSSAK